MESLWPCNWCGKVLGDLGADVIKVGDLIEQSLALTRRAGGQWFIAYLLLTLGARALHEAEYNKSVSHYSESLPMFRDINDVTGIACTLAGLGTVAWLQGDHEQSLRLHEEALANFRDSREGSPIGFCLECQPGCVRPHRRPSDAGRAS